MTVGQHPLRLTPLPAGDWTEHTRDALASLLLPERANPEGAGNVLSTLVRHPELTAAYLPFNAYLLRKSTLASRITEVAVLRTVARRNCDYLWSHHLPIAGRAGLTTEDIEAIRRGVCADPLDQLIVRAVDDLLDDSRISDATWNQLGQSLSDEQRMDLVFTIGGYLLLALAVNTFGIQDEGPHL